MTTAELKEYLDVVVDMEKSIYLQEHLATQLRNEIELLAKPKTIIRPYKPSPPSSKKNPTTSTVKQSTVDRIFNFYKNIGVLILAVIFLPFTILLLLFVIVPMTIYEIHQQNKEVQKELNAYYSALTQYHQSMEQYEADIKYDMERVAREQVSKIALQEELNRLTSKCRDSKHFLSEIYSKNIIFPKYRNLVMVCSLYEYICAGRCTMLEGHEGAYNILEMEIRLDRIITQLDTVVAKLEQIKNNQYMLYSAIQESNRQAVRIVESTQRMADSLQGLSGQAEELNSRISELQKSSALTAYETERAQKELAYMNRMNYLTGRNDGPFYNVPPT